MSLDQYQPISISQSHAHRARRTLSANWWALIIGLIGLILLPFGLVGGIALYYKITGNILPGVTAGGVSAAGLTETQLAAEIDRVWNQERSLVLVDGTRQWSVAPGFFGLRADAEGTAQAAFEVGRGQDAFSELVWLVQDQGWNTDLVVVADAWTAREQLVRWAGQVDVSAQDGSVRLDGDQVVVTPGEPGSTLDIDATLAVLFADPKDIMISGVFPVTFNSVAPVSADYDALSADVEAILSQPFKASAYDPVKDEHFSWEADRMTVAGLLKIETGAEGSQVVFDEAQIQAYLESLKADLGSTRTFAGLPDAQTVETALRSGQPLQLEIDYLPGEYVVQTGDTLLKIGWKVGVPYWRILKANPNIDQDHLVAGQTLVVPPLDELLPLPAVENKRIVIDISEQRMRVYESGNLVKEFVISTGMDKSPTQPGIFQIQTHEKSAYASVWDLTMPNFLGIYEAWPGFMNGIHGLPTLSNGNLLWASVLGKPASYGCIILNLENAEWLYNWAEDGVVVEITE